MFWTPLRYKQEIDHAANSSDWCWEFSFLKAPTCTNMRDLLWRTLWECRTLNIVTDFLNFILQSFWLAHPFTISLYQSFNVSSNHICECEHNNHLFPKLYHHATYRGYIFFIISMVFWSILSSSLIQIQTRSEWFRWIESARNFFILLQDTFAANSGVSKSSCINYSYRNSISINNMIIIDLNGLLILWSSTIVYICGLFF